ncbi:hypothetical protein N7471_013626 [Penicillium samsonianum]|uniref:uncharacterized protein n=1 Tax=Penicillium samsonianum TaxID=1882272 RepID=UPI00254954D1|nr:uncharacterized protein N7471_013626 [Penicillium samsonianum]KAJ6119006.1 hypothetical protein N7471_013626 [Penicillium samsonianum]
MMVISLNTLAVMIPGIVPKKVILVKEKVEINTPLTAANSRIAKKPYVFYATKSALFKVMTYNNSKSSEVVAYVPGTKLGAIGFGGKVHLFQKPPRAPDNYLN